MSTRHLAEQMRNDNEKHELIEQFSGFNKFAPWTESDIRYAEFLDWLHVQPQVLQDVVKVSLHLTEAYSIKFQNPALKRTSSDQEKKLLQSVETAAERLGIDVLRSS